MSLLSIGDLAQSYMLRRQNVQLKSQMSKLSEELTSGRTSDTAKHLSGDYSYLGDLERGSRVLEGYFTAATEARLFTGAMQNALEHVHTLTSKLSATLISTSNSNLPTVIASASFDARGQLATIVSSLNSNVAGRALFSGVEVDSAALAPAETILSNLRTAVAGEISLSGIVTAVDQWFDTPGGGFETLGYQGSTQGMSPYLLGEGQSVDLDLRADNPAFRDLLKNVAIAALANDPALGFATTLKSHLLLHAGQGLITAQDSLTGIRADLGFAESRIEESTSRIASEKTSLDYARGELLGVDPYESATRLENVQFQLESLYAVTARLSRLTLADYLR